MSDAVFDPNGAALPDGGVFGLPDTPEQAGVILVPVPWDVTTSYRPGTADGPRAILRASPQIDLYDVETGTPYKAGIAMLDEPDDVRAWNHEGRPLAEQVIEVGGRIAGSSDLERAAARVNDLGSRLNEWLAAEVERWLDRGKLVGVVGGDHAAPLGAIQALSRWHPGLGVLHVDAHADLRDAYEGFTWSHASIMFNAATRLPGISKLVQVGLRDLGEAEHAMIDRSGGRIRAYFDAVIQDRKMGGEAFTRIVDEIVSELPQQVYLSFDIDGLDPTLCPHTGTPVPGGLSFVEACALVAAVRRSGRTIVGFDLTEVAPDPDGGEWDGNVGARLLYKLIGWTVRA
jgi:agmatinase